MTAEWRRLIGRESRPSGFAPLAIPFIRKYYNSLIVACRYRLIGRRRVFSSHQNNAPETLQNNREKRLLCRGGKKIRFPSESVIPGHGGRLLVQLSAHMQRKLLPHFIQQNAAWMWLQPGPSGHECVYVYVFMCFHLVLEILSLHQPLRHACRAHILNPTAGYLAVASSILCQTFVSSHKYSLAIYCR